MKFKVIDPGAFVNSEPLPLQKGAVIEIKDKKLIPIYQKAVAVKEIQEGKK